MVTRRIDTLMLQEQQKPSTPPPPRVSEGTRSAREINRRVPITHDPYRLDDGIPVLRLVDGRPARQTREAVPFVPGPSALKSQADQTPPEDEYSPVDPALRRRVWLLIGVWCLACLGGVVYFVAR
jgi:hypothetical protein